MAPCLILFFCIILFLASVESNLMLEWDYQYPAFDPSFYEQQLDPDLCQQQLEYMSNNNTGLRLEFIEAGLRVPRGILSGNLVDMGNYYQCLGINEEIDDNIIIEGKYCSINVPLFGTYDGSNNFEEFNPKLLKVNEQTLKTVLQFDDLKKKMQIMAGRVGSLRSADAAESSLSFSLAVCVPKPCTTQEGLSGLLFNLTAIGFQYEDVYCRLKDDKPWVPADYVAIAIFSCLGLLTIISTSFDLWITFIQGKDSKSVNPLYRSFSVYTNGKRLTTFVSNKNSLECVDGIRAIAMMWVIIGHTFLSMPALYNTLEAYEWVTNIRSFYITTAPISVDTFFMLSGMLLVYTTAGKLTSVKLIKNLHLFYLNRILRMFPLLAALILMQVSFFHRISDGPIWNDVAYDTNVCRTYWWTTLLYVQNFILPMCQGHTWYLAIDMQLHIISPIFLYWVLSDRKNAAWISITAGLLISLVGSTIYIFINEFISYSIDPTLDPEIRNFYIQHYYIFTLTRASPFFVGMLFGYLLHIWKGKTLQISKWLVICLWAVSFILTTAAIFAIEPTKNDDFDNQTYESLVNSFMRPIWATGLGWIIFACVKGYGGPINWFLSLQMWKLLSRLSYAMYLFHYPIMLIINNSALTPIFFSEWDQIYRNFSNFAIAFLVGFVLTLIIDSPFSTLFKILLGGGENKRPALKKNGISILEHKSKTKDLFEGNGTVNGKINSKL